MFKLPEDLSKLSIEELEALHAEGLAEGRAIAELPDDDLTDEQIDRAEVIINDLAAVQGEVDTRAAALEARNERLTAIRGQVAEPEDAQPDEPAGPGEEDPAEEEEPAEEEPAKEAKVPVAASAARRSTSVASLARRAPTVIIHKEEDPEPSPEHTTLIAAANVPGYDSGAQFADLLEVSDAFMKRARSFEGSKAKGRFDRYNVARIIKPQDHEFVIDGMSMTGEAQLEVIDKAAKEARLPGGSLVAAGGWCAPSETIYDFCSLEDPTAGLISLPEVQISRGGLNYTKGPDYAALAANWGFLQTEAQAEAGTVKVCYEVECPPFQEVRLDAIGFCITAGILTNAAYPELVRRVLEIGITAHAHKKNAYVVGKLSALIGAATNYTEVGSATADVLDALNLNAAVLRATYAMNPNATIEVVLPFWAKEIIKADLSRRNGIDLINVSDSVITAYFSARNLNAQFIFDYQPLPTSGATVGQAWPAALEVMMYPAGSYFVGTSNVIDLDTVYDSVGLSTNTYTAAFFEEGILVGNRCAGGRKVAIDISCLAGVSGAAEISCTTTP
jgi:hypothetical protein